MDEFEWSGVEKYCSNSSSKNTEQVKAAADDDLCTMVGFFVQILKARAKFLEFDHQVVVVFFVNNILQF